MAYKNPEDQKRWVASNLSTVRRHKAKSRMKFKDDPAYRARRAATARKQYAARPELLKARALRGQWFALLKKCGSSLLQFLAQIHFQDHRCAICRRPFAEIKTKYNPRTLEHSHSDMRFRGVTCPSCNLLLGHAKDNPVTLDSAIRYLKGL